MSYTSPSSYDDTLVLAQYAERAYLEYAMSVVKGRALPDVRDGQKPVQRRILYTMNQLGLHQQSKPVKSARIVGDIMGKYHPHGDSSIYEAMVRMEQDFTLRYPLIDGQGNFGSRDGDNAAAMRYTEARLTPIAELLLSEINQGTVHFNPNYDGTLEEPASLPARLPMILLNGASGIAVGMATEIPSHNLTEVGQALVALIKNPQLSVADLMKFIPAPDFPAGGQIITPLKDIQNIYETGKGSLRVRARYEIEKLARGQWRVIITELPPNTSTAKVLLELEEQINPKPKAGKKQLSQEQLNTKKLMLDLLDKFQDASDGTHPVRLILEPKSSRLDPESFINTLMAQTSLEGNVPINLVMMGIDQRPAQKNLKSILQEWIESRIETVTLRLQHRLNVVENRIHILNGRLTAFLHLDEIIRLIRESDHPKTELMTRFNLSEIQAEDILEIRLRQLARLEGIKLENERQSLLEEAENLNQLLSNEDKKKQLIVKEIQADSKQFGDARRTLIAEAERAALTHTTADEPITLVLSQKGWIRSRSGHGLDLSQITFKEGDGLQQILETRTIAPLIVLDTLGRSYTIDASSIPGGRGDGIPIGSLMEMQANASIIALINGAENHYHLLSNTGGYGFIVATTDLISRVKAGKEIMKLETGETLLPPQIVYHSSFINPDCKLILATAQNRLLAFPIQEIRTMSKGRGLQLISLNEDDHLTHLMLTTQTEFQIVLMGKRGGHSQENIRLQDIENKRGRKGKTLNSNHHIVQLKH